METKDEKFPPITNTWTSTIEGVISNIGENCIGYKWMNLRASKEASRKYAMAMYLLMVLGPLSGVLSAINTEDEKHRDAIQFTITLLSFLTGFISGIIKFSRFEEKSTTHKSIATKYGSLESNIRRQLSLARNERVNAGQYLEWVTQSYDDLFTSTPLIPTKIQNEWKTSTNPTITHVPTKIYVNDNGNPSLKQSEPEKEEGFVSHEINHYADAKMKYEMNRLDHIVINRQ